MSGWARSRFEEYRDKAAWTTPQMDAYDRQIVDSTLELRDALKIADSKYNPYRVEWLDKLPGREKSELGVYSTDFLTMDPSLITLQRSLKEKLEPEDWKALIASQLEYKFVTQRPFHKRVIYRSAIPAAIVIAGFFTFIYLLTRVIGDLGSQWAIEIGQAMTFVLGLIVFVRGLPYRKKALVEADKRASALVGRDTLIRALEKVKDALAGRPELQKKWRVGPRVTPLSEAERIANLRG